MKILLGFFIGMTCCLLMVVFFSDDIFGGSRAATVPADSVISVSSDNTDTDPLPNVKQICNVALGAPYRQVATEITDPDIANFFRRYMAETGLDKAGLAE
jgi:hypothetical protein